MKTKFIALLLTALIAAHCTPERKAEEKKTKEWFTDAKFGMFIHWGPYSVLGGEWKGQRIEQGDIAEWIMERFKIPVEDYRKVAKSFNPVNFNAREWVSLAKRTGMKYIIITAKHHDGFAMYHSQVSPYNITDYTAFGRNPIRELADACAAEGIRFGVYYSHREDWDSPYAYGNTWDYDSSQSSLDTMAYPELFRKYLDEKAKPQLKELLTGYGPISIVWFDRGMYTQEQGKEFADMVHNLQPGCLVNGRVGHYDKELLGDYQSMTDNGMPTGGIEEYWETPQTLNDTWGYSKFDQHWKKPQEIIRRLVAVVSKGGNYLLNVGPDGMGVIPAPSANILNRVGNWTARYGESIYGTSASPFPGDLPWGYCTQKGQRLYLHVFDWPKDGSLEITGLNNDIKDAYLLKDPETILLLSREGSAVTVGVPINPLDSINSVVVLEITGEPNVDPFIVKQNGQETVTLNYNTASTHGRAAKRANRKGEEQQFHISRMQGPEDWIEWKADFQTAGTYKVMLTYAAIPGWEDGTYIISNGTETIRGKVIPTNGWYEYKTEEVGQLEIKQPGIVTIRLYPEKELGHYLMYFSMVELVPGGK
ncbi:MAG: alpha-L-fucosidase [Cyclobacteriaceae bacterium]|nr:alpha-L-fucosidase [Cyclobacteriaceae bacterium]